jgi:polyphosphate glucokinase
MDVLIVDVGGSSVKLWHTAHEEHRKFESGKGLTPDDMVAGVKHTIPDWTFDRIAIGLPTRISRGRPVDEPQNLGPGWVGFNFESALGAPVRIMNDACLQALGSFDGGRMLFMGLGTAVGSAFVTEGLVLNLDLGLFSHERTPLFQLLSEANLEAKSSRERRKLLKAVIPQFRAMFLADYVVLGGGGAKGLKELPEGCRRGHNRTVIEGGRRLWAELLDPADKSVPWIVR